MRFSASPIIVHDLYPVQCAVEGVSPSPEPHSGYPHFTPRREIYILHGQLGRIVDISMAGVRFTYAATDHLPPATPEFGMLFTNVDDYLDEIPLMVLSDRTVFHLLDSEYLLRERRVRFGDLTESRIRGLERFILKNVHRPQPECRTRCQPPNPLSPPGPDRIGNGLNFSRKMP